MDKKLVCSADGKRFATKQALAQHRQATHGSPGNPPKAQAKGGRSNPPPKKRANGVGRDQVVVAQPQRVVGNSGTDYARLSGTDRILHIADVKTRPAQSIVLDFLIVPSGFKRLAKVAAAFQHIVYESLEFLVEPQVSAGCAGGYVTGFVGDPDDHIVNLDQLTSTRGSVTTKWWQSSSVRPQMARRSYFTTPGLEMREFSPGRFLLMVDGVATQSGSVTIFCRWSVRLSGAILEAPPSKEVTIPNPIWIRNGHQGVWAKVATTVAADGWSDKADQIVGTSWSAGASFRLPYPVPLIKANDKVLALHHWLYVRDTDSVFLAVDGPADFYTANYEIDNLVIDAGSLVSSYVKAVAIQGEAQEPSSLDSEAMTAGPAESTSVLTELSRQLRESARILKVLCQALPSQKDDVSSVGSFSLMECPPE